MKTSTAAQNGSVKKGTTVITIAFGCVTDKGISLSWSFSGPAEAMKDLFGTWPMNLDDVNGTINNPIEVVATIATATATTAGVHADAAKEADEAKKATEKAAGDSKLDQVGSEIQKATT